MAEDEEHQYHPDQTIALDEEEAARSNTILPESLAERYRIRRVLGRGATGIVYLAEDLTIGRLVAIKQLLKHDHFEDTRLEEFVQEARIAGRLEHPNVVVVYNIEGSQESAAVVMEYLGGGSLDDLLRREAPLDPHLAVQIMLGILSGLDAAHSLGVIHRDIKPQNILFGVGANAKITDFGVAHFPLTFAGSTDSEQEMQSDRQRIVGTPRYMSPEQVMGEPVDARTDIYAAGVILYQMLTGEPHFRAGRAANLKRIRELVLNTPVPPVREKRSEVPREVELCLSQMVEQEPDKRYTDAASVSRDLVNALSADAARGRGNVHMVLPVTSCIASSPTAILEDIFYLLLLDGVITPAERKELDKRIERLGLSDFQAREIEKRVRQQLNIPPAEDNT